MGFAKIEGTGGIDEAPRIGGGGIVGQPGKGGIFEADIGIGGIDGKDGTGGAGIFNPVGGGIGIGGPTS